MNYYGFFVVCNDFLTQRCITVRKRLVGECAINTPTAGGDGSDAAVMQRITASAVASVGA